MKKSRAPGIDGLSVEFYQTFWDDIKNMLVEVFNESYKNKNLTNSQKLGAISLIFKNDKPKKYKKIIENYRPITLLNIDTKYWLVHYHSV